MAKPENMIELTKAAPMLFTLRDQITAILIEQLTVTSEGEIEGHNGASEEIILLFGSEASDVSQA